ncbi:hypothetical protein BKA70DRAFT_1247390 [Coprinopsis sp. MPI-PUGE-AT-0042]|nr:hypothetical protein BKA70DRAFT_1247390 [Coprinopsis sp. MPI-PUGE-AT-0042]
MSDLSNVDLAQQIASLTLNPRREANSAEPSVWLEEGLRRVTLSQAATARSLPKGVYELGQRPFKFVETVASVFETTSLPGKLQFSLRDDTGRLKATLWGTEKELAPFETAFNSWDYAYVCGELETWNGRNSLRIKQIRKLRDPHEPYYHLLGVMYEMQTILKLPPPKERPQSKDQAQSSEFEGEHEQQTIDLSIEEDYFAEVPPSPEAPPATHKAQVSLSKQKPQPAAQVREPETPQAPSRAKKPAAEAASRTPRVQGDVHWETERTASDRTVTPARHGIEAWAQGVAGSPSGSTSSKVVPAPSKSGGSTSKQRGKEPLVPQREQRPADATLPPRKNAPRGTTQAPNVPANAPHSSRDAREPVSPTGRQQQNTATSSRRASKREATLEELQEAILTHLTMYKKGDVDGYGCALRETVIFVRDSALRRLTVKEESFAHALECLVKDGRIYTTIDEVHFTVNS